MLQIQYNQEYRCHVFDSTMNKTARWLFQGRIDIVWELLVILRMGEKQFWNKEVSNRAINRDHLVVAITK